MQTERIFEGMVERLIGVKIRVYMQGVTLPRTVERKKPERQTTLGLSFPNPDHASTIGAKWQKYAEGRIYSELWQSTLIFLHSIAHTEVSNAQSHIYRSITSCIHRLPYTSGI